jgi:hypothetical protein
MDVLQMSPTKTLGFVDIALPFWGLNRPTAFSHIAKEFSDLLV